MQRLLGMSRCKFEWGLLTIVFLVGCSGIAGKERYVKLQRSVERYASDLRWGRYDDAVRYIARKESQVGTVDARRLEEIRVTGYEMATGELAQDSEKASITVTFTYYDRNSGRLQTLADVQHWWYDDSLDRWFLDGNLPDFIGEIRSAR